MEGRKSRIMKGLKIRLFVTHITAVFTFNNTVIGWLKNTFLNTKTSKTILWDMTTIF
jgi:hypothetical protein